MQRGTAQRVLDTLTHHIGIHVSAESVKELMGTEGKAYDTRQLTNALNTLIGKGIVDRVGRGIYVYRGAKVQPSDDQHLFETVGKLKDGSILVRSDNDEFYVLTTLEQHYMDNKKE